MWMRMDGKGWGLDEYENEDKHKDGDADKDEDEWVWVLELGLFLYVGLGEDVGWSGFWAGAGLEEGTSSSSSSSWHATPMKGNALEWGFGQVEAHSGDA